jgi:ABC-type sulfate/molybdate transport systems ATPase subunit
MTFLKVSNICRQSDEGFVLNDISFTQRKYEKIVIAGETGSGKSTVLKIIAGLLQPDAGEVILNKKRILGPLEKLVPGYEEIAWLSQHFELQKFLRVEQILEYSNTLSSEDANDLYHICQIDHLMKRRSDALSGGERQRIGLAKLLISLPTLLLLDEPFSNLDIVHKNILKEVIDKVIDKYKMTCILVSHEPADTLSWADKIIVLKDGKIVQKGTPQKIYNEPANEYVAGLFGKYILLTDELYRLFRSKKIRNIPANKIIRPEHLKLVSKGSKALPAEIVDVSFLGFYYEIKLSVQGDMIFLPSLNGNYKPGKKVFVTL